MLIITVINNEKNDLTIYVKLSRNFTMFYRLGKSSLSQVQEKLRACGNSE